MAVLKPGDNMADFPDYFRALPSETGSQVALSSFKGEETHATSPSAVPCGACGRLPRCKSGDCNGAAQ